MQRFLKFDHDKQLKSTEGLVEEHDNKNIQNSSVISMIRVQMKNVKIKTIYLDVLIGLRLKDHDVACSVFIRLWQKEIY